MLKLLQINVTANRGSTGTIVESIGEIAISRGWESFIAYGRSKNNSQSKTIKIGNRLGIYFHGLISRIFDKHGFGSIIATKKLITQIKKLNPNIIHLHNLHGYYLNIFLLFKFLSRSNIPVVWTFHDFWPITGHCTHFDFSGCNKWETECNRCPQKFQYPSSFLFDNSRKNYSMKRKLFNEINNLTIITLSNWANEIISKSFLANQNRKIIQNGIDLNVFSPRVINNHFIKKNNASRFLILGVSSVWNTRKGFNDFIELSKNLDDNFLIILVGLNRFQIDKLPSNVIGIEKTESQLELSEIYSLSDVYINLSVEETFGLTTVEALACGTPAIVYDSTSLPELIDENTGVLVKKSNISELIRAINKVKANGKIFYSKACRKRAIKFFDKKIKYSEYFEVYNSLLKINS